MTSEQGRGTQFLVIVKGHFTALQHGDVGEPHRWSAAKHFRTSGVAASNAHGGNCSKAFPENAN